MKYLNNPVDRLKQMLKLEERRSALQNEIDNVVQQLDALRGQLLAGSATPAARSAVPDGKSPSVRPVRAGRGALREKIMQALHGAGSAGVKVKDLAASLGTKPVNVYSWFHSALKRTKDIIKITGGHYRLGAGAGASSSAASAPATKPAKQSRRRGAKRGQLSAGILRELGSAGSKGITVADLADKLGAKYKNIYIWFATTGKKNPGIKRIAPATYSLSK